MEYPRNYEEAKKIIINSVGDEMEKKDAKTIKLRSFFVGASGVALSSILGLATGVNDLGLILLPANILFSLISFQIYDELINTCGFDPYEYNLFYNGEYNYYDYSLHPRTGPYQDIGAYL